MKRLLLGMTVVCSLSGCVTGQAGSWVAEVEHSQAEDIAANIALFIARDLPAANTELALEPVVSGQTGSVMVTALETALRQRGFAVTQSAPNEKVSAPVTWAANLLRRVGFDTSTRHDDSAEPSPGAVRVRYQVTRLDTGWLARVRYGTRDAAQLYRPRDATGKLVASAVTVREVSQ